MAGFSSVTSDESIMYADNVSFDGTERSGKVTSDGQLLIGSTAAPHLRPGVLTSTDGSVVITPGSGTIDLSASGVNILQDQIYYVGKHGNDANSGRNIEQAVLTFGQAIILATAQTPTAINRFSITCFDDGIYTENISIPSYVDINAKTATLTGTITIADNCNVKFFTQNVATGTTAITKPAGSAYSNVEIDIINLSGTANGCTLSTGFLNLIWKELYVVDGYGIGDISVGLGHMHLKGGDIYISGTGVGIIRANTGATLGRVDHIQDIGAGTGAAIIVYGGTIDVSVSEIHVTNAYTVSGAGCILNLFCNELIGTQVCNGGGVANLWTCPTYPINTATMPDGSLVIGSSGNNPVVATLTSGNGINVVNGPGSVTLNASGEGLKWLTKSASTPLVVNEGFMAIAPGGALSFALPAVSAEGDMVELVLDGATSWTITQPNAASQIRWGSLESTLGVTGTVASTAQGDAIRLVCETVNARWVAVGGSIGAFNIS